MVKVQYQTLCLIIHNVQMYSLNVLSIPTISRPFPPQMTAFQGEKSVKSNPTLPSISIQLETHTNEYPDDRSLVILHQ